MKFKEYRKAKDAKEAYDLLTSHDHAVILGGGVFLKMQRRTIPFLIDLADLELDKIEETETSFKIGAMTSLRQVETRADLPQAVSACTRQIGGIALRNVATIGGSVMGRYPFSDVLTALMGVGATLHFYQHGVMPADQFAETGLDAPDILMSVEVPKSSETLFAAFKPVYTDFSLVNLAISKADKYMVSIGARPNRAKAIALESLSDLESVLDSFDFNDDRRASGAYRRALAKAMVEDALKEVEKWK
jgi:CO/xanthine dehydrogenase FAD-binding subunit